MMRIGIAADHGWFELKVQLTAANKVSGVRTALITDSFSAHQGVGSKWLSYSKIHTVTNVLVKR